MNQPTNREFDHARPDASHRILLVGPVPPPYGGMALQGQLLERSLRADGHSVSVFPANFQLPSWLRFLGRVPGLRTAARFGLIWRRLLVAVRRVEVVHILAASWWYFFLVVSPAVLVGRACRRRVVLNYRGGAAERFFRFYGLLVHPIFKLAHVVTAPSGFLARPIQNRFSIPVSIVPNILDSRTFPYRERATVRPRMLVTRHLEEIYDVECVLKAFRLAQERYPEASLWIAGTGNQEKHLRGLVAVWKLRNVRFLGHVPHRDLGHLFDQCDIMLNASRIDNFPGALIEASGAGLVVISTCAGGIPSIYQHERSALLVEIGDWQQMADSVRRVIDSPTLALELTRAALETVRACDWSSVRKCLYRVYGFVPDASGDPVLAAPRPHPSFKLAGRD